MRNYQLAVAQPDLLLHSLLISRLLNHTQTGGTAAGHPTDSTID